MHITELRQLGIPALQTRANELLAHMSSLRFGSQQKEKNVKKMRALRQERARILTLLTERHHTTP